MSARSEGNHAHLVRRAAQAGFTLVELVVVMAVLAILAGLILPKLDTFKLKANKASAASNMHGISRFVTTYKVQKDIFPDQFDSLLDATGGNAFYPNLDPELTGSLPGNPTKLALDTINSVDELRSLNRVGLMNVHHLDPAVGFAGNSGGATPVTALAQGGSIVTINSGDPDGAAIIEHFYPGSGGVVPTGKKLAVFGVGPRNSMINNVLHETPFYANTNQNAYYNRFLVVFEYDTGGSRAQYLGALGADGDMMGDELVEYYEI